MKPQRLLRLSTTLAAGALALLGSSSLGAATLYWKTSTAALWTGSTWGAVPGGPYTGAYATGSDVVFEANGGTTLTITGATTNFASITANENVTVTAGGTIGTNGTVATITVASGKNLDFAGQAFSTAAGTGFVKAGAGTLTLAGGTYAGGFTLNAGTVAVGGVNAMGAGGALTINGGTIRSNSTTARDLTGKYSSITIGGDFSLGDATNTGALTFTDSMSLGAATRSITVDSVASFGGVISGAANVGLTKLGASTLTLSGANTYTGKTTVSNGTLSFNTIGNVGAASSALGAPTTVANGTIDLTGTLLYTGAVTTTDRVINATGVMTVNNSGSGALTLTGGVTGTGSQIIFRGAGNITVSGLISANNAGGTLNHTDAGTLTLTNNANSFTGNILLAQGTLNASSIANGGSVSAIGAGTTITMGQNNTSPNATFQFAGPSGGSSNRTFSLMRGSTTTASTWTLENTVSAQLLNLSGNVTLSNPVGGTGTMALALTGAGNGTLGGVISQNGATGAGLDVIKSGAGTWTLSGANTYAGLTTVSAGTLVLSGSSSATSGVTVNGGTNTTLLVTNASATGSGVINTSTGATTPVLQFHINGGGTIALPNALGGNSSITTTIDVDNNGSGSNGVVQLNGSLGNSAIGTVTYNVTGANGYSLSIANLRSTAGTPGIITFNPTTAALSLGNLTGSQASGTNTWTLSGTNAANAVTGVISNAASGALSAVSKTGAGTWTLSGANTYTGGTTVSAGILRGTVAAAFGTGSMTLSGGTLDLLNDTGTTFTGANTTVTQPTTISSSRATSGAGVNHTLGTLSIGAQTLSISTGTNSTGTTAGVTFGNVTQTGASVFDVASGTTLTLGGLQTTAQNITKQNSGTLVLGTAANAARVAGANILTAGTMRLGSVSALGTTGTTLTLNGGTLDLATDTSVNAYGTTVGGTATIVSNRATSGAGITQTLGTLSIGAQTLNVTTGTNSTGTTAGVAFGATTLTGAATFAPAANTSLTFNSTTALGANLLTKSGAGSLTLTGVVSGSTAAGTTSMSISNGVLTASGANTFTGNIAVDGSGVFAMPGATYTTTAPYGTLTGGTAYKQIFLTNGGTFRVTSGIFNDNAPTATNIGGGIIFNIGTGGGTFDVASGATLTIDDGTGTGTATTASQLQGAGNLTKTGTGTFSFDDSTAYAGTITVAAGILQPASANAFGASSAGTVIQSGAALNTNGITMTNAEPLTLAGTGLASAPVGALTNSTGTGTWVGPVTIGSGGAAIGGGAGALTLSSAAAINLGANTLTASHGASSRTTLQGVISGTGSVVVTGSGTGTGDLVLAAANTYTGGTTLNPGSFTAISVGSNGPAGSPANGPFGAGATPLVLAGGQLRAGTGGPFNIANTVTVSGDTTFYTIAGEKSLTFSGPVTLSGGTRTLTSTVGTSVAGSSVIFNGAVGDAGNALGLIKAGAGNLTLAAANTYTGGTTVNAGTLLLSGSLPTGTALTVSPTVAGGATFSLANGGANPLGSVSTLALGSATGPTTIGLELGANSGTSDTLSTTNAATAAGVINFGLLALPGFGTSASYDLISAASGLTSSSPTYALTSGPGGFTYSLSTTDSLVSLNVAAGPTGDLFWRGNTSNSWSTISGSNTNWFTDAAGTANAQSNPGTANTVNFSASNATGPTITTTLDNNFTVNNLVFGSNPSGVTGVTIAPGLSLALTPGVLTLAPAASTAGIGVASNAGNVTISAPVVLGAAQTWSVDGTGANGSSLTVSGAITGANSLTINGGGTGVITLSAAAGLNTYSGATTVDNGGILQGGATNSFSASSAMTVNGTGLLRLNGISNTIASLSGNGTVQNNHASTAATLTVGDATSTTFGGVLQNGGVGTLGLTKTGAGSLTLSGTNTYTGPTTVNAGSLLLGSPTALNSANNVTLAGTGTLDLFGNSQTIGTLTSGAATSFITNTGAGSGTDTLAFTSTATVQALISDGSTRATALRVTNVNGNFSLNNAGNTFSGGVLLTNSAGGTRLSIGTMVAGAYGSGPITVGEASTDQAGIFFGVAGQTLSNPIIVNTALGTDRVGLRADGATTLSGVITANLAPVTFTSNNASAGAFTLTNQVTGASGLVLDIVSLSAAATSFNVTLNNQTINSNNYAGDTVVNFNATNGKSATLNLGAANQIPSGSGKGNVVLNSNGTGIGTLNLAGFSETINGLNGTGTLDGASGTPTLTLGDGNASGNFSGIIKNTAGTLAVTKIGSGTQTLGGTSTYSGLTTVTAGTLSFSAGANLGSGAATNGVTLGGGTLQYTGAGALALGASRQLTLTAGTSSAIEVQNGGGNLQITAGGIIASGASSATNLTKTGLGALTITGVQAVDLQSGSLTVNGGTFTGGLHATNTGNITVGSSGSLQLADTSPVSLTLAGTATGALTLNGGSRLGLELGATGINDSITMTGSNFATVSGVVTLDFTALAGFGVGNYNLLAAPGGLTSGGGSYVLGNAPSGFNYVFTSLDTLVSLQTSLLSNIYWTNSQATGSWNTTNPGPLSNFSTDLAGAANYTLVPQATDTVIFSSTASSVGSSPINTTLDASFTVDSLRFTNQPAGATISIAAGTGGTLNLSPISSANGITVDANGGAVTISAPLTAGTSQTWSVDGTGTSSLTLSGNVTFGANVTKTGAGALTLSGTGNSGAGNFTLSGGTLNANADGALGTGTFAIGAGTTLENSSAGLVTLTGSANIWNGNFTYTGATQSLNLGTGAVTLGTSILATVSGNTLTVGGGLTDGASTFGLTKAGAGILVLNGNNTYDGATTLSAGTLTLGGTNTFTGLVSVNGGSLNLNANNSGAGGVTLAAGTFLNLNHDGALGTGTLTLNGGTIDSPNAARGTSNNNAQIWGNGASIAFTGTNTLNLGTGAVTLGDSAASTITLTNNAAAGPASLTVGGNITPGITGVPGAKVLVVAGTGSTSFGGSITKGTASSLTITDNSPGTLTLSGAASSITLLNMNGGSGSIVDLGTGNLTLNAAGNNSLQSTTGGTLNATGGGSLILGGVSDNWGTANGTTLTLNAKISGIAANTFEAFYANSGTGVMVLANNSSDFAGNVAINSGVVSVASINDVGVASGLGAGNGSGTISLGNGATTGVTLRYTGSGSTTNRVLNLSGSTGEAILDSSGSGLLKFTAATTAAAGSKALTLAGSGTGEFSNIISNGSGTVSITKTGSGTWTLSGANTYSGATIVREGTLTLSGARTGSSSGITVSDTAGLSATLNITAGTYTLGANAMNIGNAVTTAATGTVNQSGGAISFASGNAVLVGQGTVGNQGVYNLSAGSLTTFASATRGVILGVNSNPTPGPASGGGTFNLSGFGFLNMTAASGGGGDAILEIGRSDAVANNTTNVFNQSGGTANVGILAMGGGATSGSTGVNSTLTLTGGTFSANSFTVLSAGATNTSTINIGGTADVTLPAFPTVRGAGSTATLNLDGGTLRPSAASATYISGLTNAFIKAGGANLNVASGRDITISQALLTDVVSTGGGLTKAGVGALTLSGANTYTGLTTVSAGTLTAGKILSLPGQSVPHQISVAGSATLAANVGGTGEFTSADLNNLLANADFNTGATLGLDTTNAAGATFTHATAITNASAVFGTSLGLNKLGTNTLVLTGASTYTGPTTITAGTLSVASVSNIGSASPLGAGDGTTAATNSASLVFNGGTLAYTSGSGVSDRGFTMTGAGTITFPAGNNNTLTLSGNITGAGALTLNGLASNGFQNVLTLSGDNSAFTGNVTATIGGIKITNSNGLGSGTKSVTVNNGTTGNSSILLDGSAGDITLPASFTYNVSNGTNNGSFVNLAGNNTIAGQINNTSGGGAMMATSLAGNLMISANMTATTSARALILNGPSTGTVSGVVSNGSTPDLPINKTGTGTWTLSGANTSSGVITIGEGGLSVGSINSVTGGTASSNLGHPTTVATGTIALGGGVAGYSAATATGGLIYTGSGETTDRVIKLAGTTGGGVIDQSGTGLLKFTSNVTAPGTAAVDNRKTLTLQGSTAGTGEIGGVIADSTLGTAGQLATSVTKAGSGTWTLSGVNTYTGGTTVTAGTLVLGHATNTLSNTGAVTVSGGILSLGSNSDTVGAVTLAGGSITGTGVLTGSGYDVQSGSAGAILGGSASLAKTTGGTATLTGVNTYTGGTTLNAGTLSFANGSLGTTGAITFAASSTLRWETGNTQDISSRLAPVGSGVNAGFDTNGNNVDLASVISGAGSLVKTGSGTLTLSGTNTYAGGTSISGGTARAGTGNTAAFGAGSITLSTGATLDLNNVNLPNSITNNGGTIIGSNGSASIAQNGGTLSGTVGGTINATGTVGGTPTITGLLQGNATFTGAVTIGSGGFLKGTGNFSGGLVLNAGSTLAPGNSPGTVTGTNATWNGGSSYVWEVNNTAGTAGANPGWDLLALSGTLDLTGATSSNRITVKVTSLNGLTAGNAAGFDPYVWNQSWSIVTSAGVTAFDPDKFTVDITGFSNDPSRSWAWSVAEVGGIINLNYVPEPSTYAALAGAAALGLAFVRRRRAGRAQG